MVEIPRPQSCNSAAESIEGARPFTSLPGESAPWGQRQQEPFQTLQPVPQGESGRLAWEESRQMSL